MRNDVIHLISHLPKDVSEILQAREMGADHVIGATGFTADATHRDGEQYSQHRFALLLVADPNTAHEMMLNNEIGAGVVEGLLDRFRDLLYGVFGEEVVALAMMQGIASMLGTDEEEDTDPSGNATLN